MNLLPKKNTWRKTILFYRFLRYRKGFGVHSPFAFALITRVINERWGFYCYDDIELIRRQLVHKGSTGVRREIKCSHGQLLFRVVNYFKPKRILQIGSPAGIATLYLTSYASDIQCIALEADAESARETAWCVRKYAHAPAEVLTGDYKETLPQALQKLGTLVRCFSSKESGRMPRCANSGRSFACGPKSFLASTFTTSAFSSSTRVYTSRITSSISKITLF